MQKSSSTGMTLYRKLKGEYDNDSITDLRWFSSGSTLASVTGNGNVKLWSIKSTNPIESFLIDNSYPCHIAISSDEKLILVGGRDNITLWDIGQRRIINRIEDHNSHKQVSWAPNREIFAFVSGGLLQLWKLQQEKAFYTTSLSNISSHCIAWSPDGTMLAFSYAGQDAYTHTIKIIRMYHDKNLDTYSLSGEHLGYISALAWSSDGRFLASSSGDKTIVIWNPHSGQKLQILEGQHLAAIYGVAFSSDGRLLASTSKDGTLCIWRTDLWEVLRIIRANPSSALAFQPGGTLLAALGLKGTTIHLWDLDTGTLLRAASSTSQTHYTNAKIVLLGDSGVGKSGLGLVLTGQPFAATESTHGRHVRFFDNEEVKISENLKELREILLWDLAGQPGYRLIHQLHLDDVTVALIVFDARSEIDPFAGVFHWNRALLQAQKLQSHAASALKKFLVIARADRGGTGVSNERIQSLIQQLGFEGFFETSAKTGMGVKELTTIIKGAIDWNALPRVSSTILFQGMREFLLKEKSEKHLLSTTDDLYRMFLKFLDTGVLNGIEELYTQFEICIGRLEARGLIRRLKFGNLILLQPELLDFYASALINAVRDEPDGLGNISEEKVQNGSFPIPEEGRLTNKEQERLLLIAMIEDLLRYDLVLREQADDSSYLIFPSQSTREHPDLLEPTGKTVKFHFEGAILNIYTTLAVRLSHSGFFTRKEMWKNGVAYSDQAGHTCGIFLDNQGEGQGNLTLFFDLQTHSQIRLQFEKYIYAHLMRRAIPQSVQRRRSFVCSACGEPFTDSQVKKRRERNINWIQCSVCDTQISILDSEEHLSEQYPSLVSAIDSAANEQNKLSVNASILKGKIAIQDFDVFLCHNGRDKPAVLKLGEQLKIQGILPWLDEWEVPPGSSWQRALEKQIEKIKSVAILIGTDGIGPWQRMEIEVFLRMFVAKNRPVIPVFLESVRGSGKNTHLPVFLGNLTWVDFKKQQPDPMKHLIWGITGNKFQ